MEGGAERIEVAGGVPVLAWIKGVPLEEEARRQLENVARLPVVAHHVAVMPDVHWGIGATVGSVVATRRAIIPAAVGVDIGCGMQAMRTSLVAADLPDDLKDLRRAIERAVPHGRTDNGGRNDRGSFRKPTAPAEKTWRRMQEGWKRILADAPALARGKTLEQLGTLGSGNHFIELALDEEERVWVMLHSGSRGVGNRIGMHYIERARSRRRDVAALPDGDLAWLDEGAPDHAAYVFAVDWAQRFARFNRELMMEAVLAALRASKQVPKFKLDAEVVDCHHNYVRDELHFGETLTVTRKGAVSARQGELGIIPGSMGAASFIVRGLGHPDSFTSCSHGAGRAMSRGEARRRFTLADHEEATRGVECKKDASVLDETPGAYKEIEAVMAAQRDLVDVVHRLRQVVCVKG